MMRCLALVALCLSSIAFSAPAVAPKGPRLCPGYGALPAPDANGRIIGHFPYAEASAADLAPVPKGFGSGNCQLVHKDMLPALTELVKAARADKSVGNSIMGLSCHRTIKRQQGLFCNPAKLKARGISGQARWIAPPGFSEHQSGYTLDFAARNVPGCQASTCFAGTAVSRWLLKNGKRYGFEVSFPKGNKQGVGYEPWHWRWVGLGDDAASRRARAVFAKARGMFPVE